MGRSAAVLVITLACAVPAVAQTRVCVAGDMFADIKRFSGDPTSTQTGEQVPPYNAYSIDGDVTGPLVYVNFGRPVDYEELDRRGISVRGAIVIARSFLPRSFTASAAASRISTSIG